MDYSCIIEIQIYVLLYFNTPVDFEGCASMFVALEGNVGALLLCRLTELLIAFDDTQLVDFFNRNLAD